MQSFQEYENIVELRSISELQNLQGTLDTQRYILPKFEQTPSRYKTLFERLGIEPPLGEPTQDGEVPGFITNPFADKQQVPDGVLPILESGIPLSEYPQFTTALSENGECDKALREYSRDQDKMVENPVINARVDRLVQHCYDTSIRVHESVERARAATVLIGYGDRTHCTGYLIDASHVLTAAHCFTLMLGGVYSHEDFLPMSCVGFWIRTSNSKSIRRNITGISARSSKLLSATCLNQTYATIGALDEDIVVASLDEPVPEIQSYKPPSRYVELSSGTTLLILGRSPKVDRVDDGTPAVLPLYSGACRLIADVASEEGRIIHQCLTVNAMSGAPIFAIDESRQPLLIGVHQRALIGPGMRRCSSGLKWCKKYQTIGFANAGHIVNLNRRFSE